MDLATITTENVDERRALLMSMQALLNQETLTLIALLSSSERSVRELTALVGKPQSLAAGALGRLRFLELISCREQDGQQLCRLDPRALHRLNGALQRLCREQFAGERAARVADSPEVAESKVLHNYFRGERLIEIPASNKALLVVIKWLVTQFEPGVRYPEREVNTILKRHHEDFATLRRAMIDNQLMARENGVYWRTPAAEA